MRGATRPRTVTVERAHPSSECDLASGAHRGLRGPRARGGRVARVVLERGTRRFADVTAVDDLSLEVRDREFLVLVGPSGCGKTTALRIVVGLEEATEGEIFIASRRVTDLPPGDRDIAMVFQSYALYPH